VPNVDSDDEKRKAADKAYKDIHESLEAKRRRDEIYHDWVLNDFWLTEPAQEAKLTKAEVAALRLYTGPAYKPINAALRQQNVEPWATTIACCYTAVLKLSFLSTPKRVYRGVKESQGFKLHEEFLNPKPGGFAGGTELAFMSTTADPKVAVFYAGTGPGSVFMIDYTIASRAADISFLSQFPHEKEFLFPPNTMLECTRHETRGDKRLVVVAPTVSTNTPRTNSIMEPDTVPSKGKQKLAAELAAATKVPPASERSIQLPGRSGPRTSSASTPRRPTTRTMGFFSARMMCEDAQVRSRSLKTTQ